MRAVPRVTTKARAVTAPQAGGKATRIRGGVKLKDVAVFARQFSTMINAGVSLVRCLSTLVEQTSSRRLRAAIVDMQQEVEAGVSLSSAMARHPGAFSNLALGLVRAGEVGGVLDESLERLAGFIEKDVELRRKVKSAMTYPVLVVGMAVIIVLFLVTFILPKFAKLFADLGAPELPLPTQFLMDVSHFLTHGFPGRQLALAGVAVLLLFAWRAFTRTQAGRRFRDRVKLRVPVLGALNRKIATARFARTLGTLLTSGVPILQAMEAVAGTVDNEVIAEAVMKARASVREGESLASPLRKSGVFPPMVCQMISIGEETGSLDHMLGKIADFYEAEVDAAVQSLTASLEPVMIVVLGGMVGFIVIAMFLPMVKVLDVFMQ